jgi:hypothetical protein
VYAGTGTTWNRGAAHGTIICDHVYFHGWISTAVEYLPGKDLCYVTHFSSIGFVGESGFCGQAAGISFPCL